MSPGDNPIAVNKHIISYHCWKSALFWAVTQYVVVIRY